MKTRFSLLLAVPLALAVCSCNVAQDSAAIDLEPEAKPESQPRVEAKAAVKIVEPPAAVQERKVVPPSPNVEPPKPRANTEKTSEDPAPLAQLQRIHTHRTYFNARTSNSLKRNVKLPESADVMCGQFPALAGKNTLACITRADKSGRWESIVIDVNRNRDLTDDEVYPLPANRASEEFVLKRDGREIAFTAFASQNNGQVNFGLRPAACRTGEATINGMKAQWVACDCNLTGKLDLGDRVHIDGNANGKLTEPQKDPVLTLSEDALLYHEQNWYSVASTDGEQLRVALYDGEMKRLTIDHGEITGEKGIKHDLRLYLHDRMLFLGGVDPEKGAEVPPSVIKYLAGTIKLTPKAVGYSVRNINLKEDKALKLTPPKSQLSVSQSGGKIHVNQKIVSEGGVSFNIARAKPGPAVEVYSEKNPDEPLTKGNMAYG